MPFLLVAAAGAIESAGGIRIVSAEAVEESEGMGGMVVGLKLKVTVTVVGFKVVPRSGGGWVGGAVGGAVEGVVVRRVGGAVGASVAGDWVGGFVGGEVGGFVGGLVGGLVGGFVGGGFVGGLVPTQVTAKEGHGLHPPPPVVCNVRCAHTIHCPRLEAASGQLVVLAT